MRFVICPNVEKVCRSSNKIDAECDKGWKNINFYDWFFFLETMQLSFQTLLQNVSHEQ